MIPLPMLVAALLTGGGAAINWKMQNDALKAQNAENRKAMEIERAAREAERTRQRGMERLQADAVAQALAAVDPAQTASRIDAESGAADDPYVLAAEDYNVPTLPGQNATGDTAHDIGRLVADKLAQTRGILKAQSTLARQGTALGGNQDRLARMAGDIMNTGRDRTGSLAASQLETTVPAATVTASTSPLGDLLMLGGMLYGGLGGFGSARKPLVAPGTARMVAPRAAAGSIFGAPLYAGKLLPDRY